MSEKIELSLVQNASDFLNEAITNARSKDNRAWKYAVLHLTNSIELMMKAVLEQEHWSLIFENVDLATKENLRTGKFRSVNFETAISRLIKISSIEIRDSEIKKLRKIRDLRNKITHYNVSVRVNELQSIVARGLGVFIKLYKNLEDADAVREVVQFINSQLHDFEKYVKFRLAEIKEPLEESERPTKDLILCPMCFQNTIIRDNGNNQLLCLFCETEFGFDELADYTDGVRGPCPECIDGVLASIEQDSGDTVFLCTKCGFDSYSNYNVRCESCENVFWDENAGENYICENCLKSMYGD